MNSVEGQRGAVLVPFPTPEMRPLRAPDADAGPGAILLFTGVRYERQAPEAPPCDDLGKTKPRSGGRRGRR